MYLLAPCVSGQTGLYWLHLILRLSLSACVYVHQRMHYMIGGIVWKSCCKSRTSTCASNSLPLLCYHSTFSCRKMTFRPVGYDLERIEWKSSGSQGLAWSRQYATCQGTIWLLYPPNRKTNQKTCLLLIYVSDRVVDCLMSVIINSRNAGNSQEAFANRSYRSWEAVSCSRKARGPGV